MLIIQAESVSKALNIATEAIKAVNIADLLEYEKDNNSQSSQNQIKITKKMLTAKVKKVNDARKKTSDNEVKRYRDLTFTEFKTAISDIKTIGFYALFLESIQTSKPLLLICTPLSDSYTLFWLFWSE